MRDGSFPLGQFYNDGLGLTIKRNRGKRGGRIMLYTREDIPIKFYVERGFMLR